MRSLGIDMGRRIGDINNYYGGVRVKTENEKFYWGIENYDGTTYKEIPGYLYSALIKFDNQLKKQNKIN